MNQNISLQEYNIDNKRFTQHSIINKCKKLFNQKIMFTALLQQAKACGFRA